MNPIIDERTAPYAALLLRVALGMALLAHSAYRKVIVFTIPGTIGFFATLGLPAIVAWGALVIEIVAGTMLIVGWLAVKALLGPGALAVGVTSAPRIGPLPMVPEGH